MKKLQEAGSRFDAQIVVRVVTLTEERRLELHLRDAGGKTHVVSLPLTAAIELGSLICDTSDAAPYIFGGIRRPSG
jgi:ssRNA-specific RNase YbeY (16S rRNA maturation enzyme)